MPRKQDKTTKCAMIAIVLGWVCAFAMLLFPEMSREALMLGFVAVALISFGAGMMAARDDSSDGDSDDGSAAK